MAKKLQPLPQEPKPLPIEAVALGLANFAREYGPKLRARRLEKQKPDQQAGYNKNV